MYAVADSVYPQDVYTCKPQKSIKTLCMDEFLPTPVVQEAFVEDLTDVIPRILVTYLKAYMPMSRAVTYHITHPHSDEMNSKSEWVIICLIVQYFFCKYMYNTGLCRAVSGWRWRGVELKNLGPLPFWGPLKKKIFWKAKIFPENVGARGGGTEGQ